MSDPYANSHNGLGAPTLTTDAPATTPPAGAGALGAPAMPVLADVPVAAPAPPAPPESIAPMHAPTIAALGPSVTPVAAAAPVAAIAPAAPFAPAAPVAPLPVAQAPHAPVAAAPQAAPAPVAAVPVHAPTAPVAPAVAAPAIPAAVPAAAAPTVTHIAEVATQPTATAHAMPSLPPAGIPVPKPAHVESGEQYGLPTAAQAPTEIPDWKRRQNSKIRKFGRRLVLLIVLAGIGAGGYFTYTTQLVQESPDEDPPAEVDTPAPDAPAEPATPIGGVIDDAETVTEQINDNGIEEELLGELGVPVDPAAPVDGVAPVEPVTD